MSDPTPGIPITPSSGNVFADMGCPDADRLLRESERMIEGGTMSTETQHPIWVCSAWGMSPRMAADAFAAGHWAVPHRVAEFRADGRFRLGGGTRCYRVVAQPGVPGVSEATYGVIVEGEGR